jgi:hypothetical protein
MPQVFGMDGKMKTIAQIVCISTFFLAQVARIGAGEDVQAPSLFDQVREAIPKLKPGMKFEGVKRILQMTKLEFLSSSGSAGLSVSRYSFPGNPNQRLSIETEFSEESNEPIVRSAALLDGRNVVAKFDADKK